MKNTETSYSRPLSECDDIRGGGAGLYHVGFVWMR